jgi:hypothetical protein
MAKRKPDQRPAKPGEPVQFVYLDIEEDEPTGGGIPDDDGYIYLNRHATKKAAGRPEKRRRRKR